MTGVVVPPSSTLSITKDGKPYSVFMSFGLLNQLTRHLGDIDQLPMLAVDPEVQEKVLKEIFSTRDERGTVTYTPSLFEINVSVEDIDRVLDFVGDHIANFFMAAAEKSQKRVTSLHAKLLVTLEKVSSLTPTKTGSQDSPSSTPAA